MNRRRTTCLLTSLGLVLVTGLSWQTKDAKAHSIDADGTINLKINYRYPPSADDTQKLERELRKAQLSLCDATEGQLKLSNVQVTLGDAGQADADVWLLPQNARSFNSLQINLYPGGVDGQVIAHEIGHRIFGLGESYEEQERWGTACGIGPSFDGNLDEANNSIMQQAQGFVCVDSVNQRALSSYEPLWWDRGCSTDADCLNVCDRAPCPIDPMTGTFATFECPATPPLNSEMSTGVNHDLIMGSGVVSCPLPKPATRLVFSARMLPTPAASVAAFDPTSFDTAAATSNYRGSFRLLDNLGRVDPAVKSGGQSVHLVNVYLRHDAGTTWEMHVLGRAEEFGGTEGDPQFIKSVTLDFSGNVVSTIDGNPGNSFDITLGDGSVTPAFVAGDDSVVADPLDVEVQLAGLTTNGLPAPITADGTYYFVWERDTGVFAGAPGAPNERQQGLCGDDALCARSWNDGTGRFETADHTFRSSVADQMSRTAISDWEHTAAAIASEYTLLVPPDVPTAAPLTFADCGGAITVDPIPAVDRVMLVMDRSGSMEELVGKPATGSQTRLEFAQAAARAFVDLQADRGIEVGIVSYSDEAVVDQGLATVDDASTPATFPGSIDSTIFTNAIDALVADGSTATGPAMTLAGDQLGDPSTGNRVIILLSDGEANRAPGCESWIFGGQCVKDDLKARTDELQDREISVYSIASGGAADQATLAEVATQTGGHVFAAPDGDDLPMVYAEISARIRGDSLALERTESWVQGYDYCGGGEFPCNALPRNTSPEGNCVCGDLPPREYPEQESFTIPVQAGAGRLNLVVSSRDAVAADWGPYIRLEDPSGHAVTADIVHKDDYYEIHSVNTPTGGDWTVTLFATKDHVEKSYLMAHVEDPRPDCFAEAQSFVVEQGEDAIITASAHYDVTLGAGVNMSGRVKLPNGESLDLTFEHNIDPSIGYRATIPSDELELKGGRGVYNVTVSCEVADGVKPQIGESIFAEKEHPGLALGTVPPAPDVDVEAFGRTIRTAFFYDTTTMPPVRPGVTDSDGDGILDVDEGPGDMDGDGIDDIWDTDADNDDIPDRDDPQIAPPCQVLGGSTTVATCLSGPQPIDLQIPSGCEGALTSFNGGSLNASIELSEATEFVPGTYEISWGTHTQTFEVILSPESGACCAEGQTLLEGTAQADAIFPSTPVNYCVLGYESADYLLIPNGSDSLFGGDGADYLNAGGGNDLVVGGAGSDYIYGTGILRAFGGEGADSILAQLATSSAMYGGGGLDQLVGGPGSDVLMPGSGGSFASGGAGDDTVVLYHECEATPGTFLSGDTGYDTLITPLSLAELAARGVSVVSFENIIIDETRGYLSDCQ